MQTASPRRRAPLWALVGSNALGGVGAASGIAVGALFIQSMGGTALAGVGQALQVLGTGLLAVPLATVAAARGRRLALTLGYGVAAVGGLVVIGAAVRGWLWLAFVGLLLFGAAPATNLQTRFAASDLAEPAHRAREMSLVVWATTIGALAGPNLLEAGAEVGRPLGVPDLAGPYVFSVLSFLAAGLVVGLLFRPPPAPASEVAASGAPPAKAVSAAAALRWAARHPVARFGVVLIVVAHAVMVGLMSMATIHLADHQHSLRIIGVVISLHILGMFAFSPVFGWLADRFGAMRVALGGLVTLAVSVALGVVAGWDADVAATVAALLLLGLGWSACLIASSALLAGVDSGKVRVPLQGATDALMNYGGAVAAVLSAPVLAAAGFSGLSVASGLLLVPALAAGWVAHRARPGDGLVRNEPAA